MSIEHGDPRLPERFWDKVVTESVTDCWLWSGARNPKGYGHFGPGVSVPGSRSGLAHRVSYEALCGPIGVGLQLDHLCRVTRCVNPAHLEPVTPRENVLRSEGVAAFKASATHCPHDHAYSEDNRIQSQPGRSCRECGRRRNREYKARQRAKQISGNASC